MASPDLAEFLSGAFDAAKFRHADHVRIAFALLERHDFAEAALLFSRSLRAVGGSAYHETITLAFLSLIAERRAEREAGTFAQFTAANRDLFDKSILRRWYGAERLASPVARATFVLPEPAPGLPVSPVASP